MHFGKKVFKKRIIALILFVIIGITAATGYFAQYSWASEKTLSFNQYKADYYLDYSPYEYYMSSKFTLPYRTVVDKNRNDMTYQALINTWQLLTFNLSDITEYSKKRIGYYEAFLFDILYTGYEPTNLTKEMNNTVKSVQASSLKKVSKMAGISTISYGKKNLDKMSEEEVNKLSDALGTCIELQEAFGAIGKVSEILGYASNVEELIYKLAKIEAISHLSNETAAVLREIAVNTKDASLSAACLELAAICSNSLSKAEIITLMASDMIATEMADWALGEIWNSVVEKLKVYGIALSVGQGLGKWSSGLLFSTDKEIETYYEMSALYDFEDELKKVAASYGQKYASSRTDENAKLYNTAFEMLLKTFQLSCDISIDYAAATYDSGIVNLFISYVSGNHDKFEKYKASLNEIKNEILLLYEFANVNMYNLYREEYCLDIADELNMEPETNHYVEEDVTQSLNDLQMNIFKCCDVHIDEDMTLTQDMETYGDLYLEGGTVDLNGYTMKVNGNLLQKSGDMKINGGRLEVSGDYRLQDYVQNNTTDEWEYVGAGSYLYMEKEKDYVKVDGSMYVQSWMPYNKFKAGTLEIGGDFKQLQGDSSGANFQCEGTHRIIFSGEGKQRISFENAERSYFNDVEFQNEDVEIVSKIKGWILQRDMTFKYGLENGIIGTFDLNGHTMKVNGNLLQKSGDMKINGGRLEVSGDYRLQDYVQNNTTDEWEYVGAGSYLYMEKEKDYVKVDGSMYVQSWMPYNKFKAGTLEIGGDFKQLQGDSSGANFQCEGTHRIIFSGEGKQRISFENAESSYFNDVEFQNEDVEIASKIRGWTLQRDTTFKYGLENGITGTFDLNGHTMKVNGNLLQKSGDMKINGGRLEVSGDYRLQDYVQNSTTDEWEYVGAGSYLYMEKEKDYVKVDGSMYVQSWMPYNKFKAGTLEIGGDFKQLQGDSSGANFQCEGTHKVILNGKKKQTVSFESTSSYFNILILTKDKDEGYSFIPDNCWKTLQYMTDIPEISDVVSAEEMEQLIAENKEQDTVIQTEQGVIYTFEQGGMQLIDGKESYDFGAEISQDYSALTTPPFAEDALAFRIDYNYEGQLPGKAKITIPVDDKFIGARLYYYEIGDNGEYKYIGRTKVAGDGTYTIGQEQCSGSYVATTKAPENLGNVDGQGDITTDDALIILKQAVGMVQTGYHMELADCDGADGITTDDALLVLKRAVGMEVELL